jgi:hypothetical protein
LNDDRLTSDRRHLAGVLAGFIAMAVLAALDLLTDLGEGTTALHLAAEGAVVTLGLLGAGLVTRRLFHLAQSEREALAEVRGLRAELAAKAAEAARWREQASDLLRGLGSAMDDQFDRWGLTPAEKRSPCCSSKA